MTKKTRGTIIKKFLVGMNFVYLVRNSVVYSSLAFSFLRMRPRSILPRSILLFRTSWKWMTANFAVLQYRKTLKNSPKAFFHENWGFISTYGHFVIHLEGKWRPLVNVWVNFDLEAGLKSWTNRNKHIQETKLTIYCRGQNVETLQLRTNTVLLKYTKKKLTRSCMMSFTPNFSSWM